MSKALVGIIMGSDSDLPVMRAAIEMCEEFGIDYEVDIVSAHRTPEKLVAYSTSAEERGIKVIIAGAGGAAHLPGMVASLTVLPVIGVPVRSSSLDGMDSLLSIVQMPGGVPVATVAINGAKNAGILAAQIIGSGDASLRQKIAVYKNKLKSEVEQKSEKLQKVAYKQYLKEMVK
ncbi:MAG: 5-(carboxyamino)imidazole ribonucleotide mutase [Sulfuricurvum sp.]|nr:5-(carboxyamino)imidazole ribonucleotide mutase [Sulfuricurvum sp.]